MSTDGDDLPRAHIKRIVKAKLTELMSEGGPDAKGKTVDGHVQKEALMAFSECAKIFIHYLTSTANDICRDGKRQTISVEDVFKAIDELEFGEFGEPLRQALTVFKKDAAAKVAKRTEKDAASKKRKATEEGGGAADTEEGGADAGEDDGEEEEEEEEADEEEGGADEEVEEEEEVEDEDDAAGVDEGEGDGAAEEEEKDA